MKEESLLHSVYAYEMKVDQILGLSVLITNIFLNSPVYTSKAEATLLKQLLKIYDKKERPAKIDTDPINVNFTVYLRQVIDVEEKLQIIQSNLWLVLTWYDYRLRWNPAEHENITRVIIPISSLWCPDILLYNSATENFDPTFKVNAETYSDGEIKWTPPGIFSSTCSIDIRFFPFDTQHCKMKFSSWTYDMARINLTLPMKGADVTSYIPNGEWDLIAAPAVRNEQKYDCCPEVYVDVTYTIIIARRPMFYLFNLVLPTVLMSIIALLTFVLPVESGEKVTLCVTILLSICVFLLLVMELLPATSDAIPLLGLYFGVSTMLLSISVVSTIFVLNLHFRTPATCTFPRWIRVWINGRLAWLLRMQRPEPEEEETVKRRPTVIVKSDLALSTEPMLSAAYLQPEDDSNVTFPAENPADDIRWRMRQIVRELRTITKKMEQDEEDEDVCEEWKFAASVIDRLCFWIFGLMILALTLFTLFIAPNPKIDG